ncbi:hypothetical protein GE061_010306, partial [Apolygus lucorum]
GVLLPILFRKYVAHVFWRFLNWKLAVRYCGLAKEITLYLTLKPTPSHFTSPFFGQYSLRL